MPTSPEQPEPLAQPAEQVVSPEETESFPRSRAPEASEDELEGIAGGGVDPAAVGALNPGADMTALF
jgi:hypothetical protein